MSKRALLWVIGVLGVVLLFQTGYIAGRRVAESDRASVYEEEERPDLAAGLSPDREARRFSATGLDVPDPDREDDIWDPFLELQRMHRAMNRMFGDTFSRAPIAPDAPFLRGGPSFEPAVDVKEIEDGYLVIVDLPGVDKDTINITAEPYHLSISGERVIESEHRDDGSGFFRAERSFGSFRRTIPLAHKIVPEEISAETAEGVLLIKLPKATEKVDHQPPSPPEEMT